MYYTWRLHRLVLEARHAGHLHLALVLLTLVLFLQLCDRGMPCHKLHGKEGTRGKHRTVQQFEQGPLGLEHGCAESKVLITTDMYSRGYDVPAVSPSHSRHLHDLR